MSVGMGVSSSSKKSMGLSYFDVKGLMIYYIPPTWFSCIGVHDSQECSQNEKWKKEVQSRQRRIDSRNGRVLSPLPEKKKIARTSPSVPSRFRGQLEAFTPPKRNQTIRRAIYSDDSNEIESSPLKKFWMSLPLKDNNTRKCNSPPNSDGSYINPWGDLPAWETPPPVSGTNLLPFYLDGKNVEHSSSPVEHASLEVIKKEEGSKYDSTKKWKITISVINPIFRDEVVV